MEKLLSSLQKVEVGYNVASITVQQTLLSSASESSLVLAATVSLSWETNGQLWNYLKKSGALKKLPLSILLSADMPNHQRLSPPWHGAQIICRFGLANKTCKKLQTKAGLRLK